MHVSWKAVRKTLHFPFSLHREEKMLPSKRSCLVGEMCRIELDLMGKPYIYTISGWLASVFFFTRPLPPYHHTHIPPSTKKTKSSAALFFRLLVEWMFGSLCFCCCLLYSFPSQSDQPRLCSANDTIAVPWEWRKYKNAYMGTYDFCSRQKKRIHQRS